MENPAEDKARKELKVLAAKMKKVVYKSPDFWILASQQVDIKKAYLAEHGKDALTLLVMPRRRKDGLFKSQNSKGNGYGNM
jgi:hypothetical protein